MMSKTTNLTFERSDGERFIIDETNWKLTSLSGIDAANINIFTEKNAQGDGETVTASRVQGRDISFTAKTINQHLNEAQRMTAIRFFNPKYTYKLYITYQGRTLWIDCLLSAFSAPSKNVYQTITISAELYCPQPYFKSIDRFGRDIASIQGRFGFPYMSHPTLGFLVGVYNFAQEILIENDGDVDTYCTAVFHATDEVVNPQLIQGDKYVRILDTMHSGDIYTIDFIKATVTKNGNNAINKIDRTSTISEMKFAIGENRIKFDVDSGGQFLKVLIYYNKLYVGM